MCLIQSVSWTLSKYKNEHHAEIVTAGTEQLRVSIQSKTNQGRGSKVHKL